MAVIREAAATEIMPRFLSLKEEERWEKRSGSVVTAADVASERFLSRELSRLLPGSMVVGEEMIEEEPERLDLLDGAAPIWVLDPVDGTRNFARGSSDFAVMVAVVVRRQPVAGWIYRPTEDSMYAAEAGAGAYRDGHRLSVEDAPVELSSMSGSLGTRLRRNKKLTVRFASVTATHCIGVDYCALADGYIQFAHYRGVNAWDHAPGFLLYQEAGGHCRSLDGTSYRVGSPGRGGLLLATDPLTWERLQQPIIEALEPGT